MRLVSVFRSKWIAGIVIACSLSACQGSSNDKAEIVAIWQLHSINVNGMEIGDGKGYLHFKDDGNVISRTGPGLYDEGKFEINPEKKEIVMKQDTTQMKYVYTMGHDSLAMKSNDNGMTLVLRGHKVAQLPIKRVDDVPEEQPVIR